MKPLILISTLLLLWPRLASADNPRLVIENGGHLGTIRRIVFTGDGRRLISAGDDKVIRVWNLKTGAIERTLRGQIGDGTHGAIYALAVSPDNRYVAVGGYMAEPLPADQTTDTLERRRRLGAIRVFDILTGELSFLLRGNVSVVNALAFSPTDPNVLASAAAGGQVMLWKLSERSFETIYRHSGSTRDVSFSPNGQRLASAGDDGVLRLWDLKERRSIKDQRATPEGDIPLTAAAFSPRNDFVATAGGDGMVTLWDGRTGGFLKILGRQLGPINSLAFSSDNSLITGPAAGTTRWSYLLSTASDKVAKFHRHDTGSEEITTAFSPSSNFVAISTGDDFRIKVFNVQTQRLLQEFGGKGRYVQSVAISQDGRSVGFGDSVDFKSNNNRGPLTQVFALAPESDSYGVSLRGKINNASNFIRAKDTFQHLALQMANDGNTGQASLQMVSKDNSRLIHSMTRSASSGRKHLAYTFTRDGEHIISGGENGVLLLYDRKTGNGVFELKGHTGAVTSVAVSADNRTLVSGSNDQTLRVWDIPAAARKSDDALLLTVFVSADNDWVAWTPHGYYTSSLNGDKYIGWHVNQGDDKAAKYYGAVQFQKAFYRPDVVAEYLKSHDIKAAVRIANSKRRDISPTEGVLNATAVSFTLPPEIKIETPAEDETTVATERLKIKATVTSEGLPITNVKIYFNGELHSLLPVNGPKTDLSMTVKLNPGVNVLSIIAFTRESSSEPEDRRITYRPADTGQAVPLTSLSVAKASTAAQEVTALKPILSGTKMREGYARAFVADVAFSNAFNKVARAHAPQVRILITSPKHMDEVQDSKLIVEGVAISATSSTIPVKLFLNGEEEQAFNVGEDVTFQASVSLRPGMNVLEATASDQSSSHTARLEITYKPIPVSTKKTLLFLGIGVNKSLEPTLTPLKYAEKDVSKVEEFFKQQGTQHGAFEKVVSKAVPNVEINDPNRKAILDGFKWLKEEASQHTNAINIIYLAGHGNNDGAGGGYFFFTSEHKNPPDEVYDMPWSSIAESIRQLQFRGATILFLDTCRAGAANPYFLKSLATPLATERVIVFTASDEGGASYESDHWEGGHGAFTAAVLKGLKGEADREPKNREVTLDELKVYIRKKVTELAGAQKAEGRWVTDTQLDEIVLSRTGGQ